MKELVPSLETCKALREAGFPQETKFFWCSTGVAPAGVVLPKEKKDNSRVSFDPIAAPTAEEILRELPIPFIHEGRSLEMFIDRFHELYLVGYAYLYDDDKPYQKSLSEAAAQMYLYLKKEKLI